MKISTFEVPFNSGWQYLIHTQIMLHYYDSKMNWSHEISREKFYSMRRRKNAHVTACYNCGQLTGYILKFY